VSGTRNAVQTHIALLRGVNVGGNHKLPMKNLARIFEESGAENAKTFIQSGNVIFDSESENAKYIALQVRQKITAQFGFDTPVLIRTSEQMQSVCDGNPYIGEGLPESKLYVMFLADIPSKDQLALLDSSKFLPDSFTVAGQEIYLSLPVGAATTKLTNATFDRTLGTVSTSRNWRTVCSLAELAALRSA
jgi:uncharacterized protein (DUF1697 family)